MPSKRAVGPASSFSEVGLMVPLAVGAVLVGGAEV